MGMAKVTHGERIMATKPRATPSQNSMLEGVPSSSASTTPSFGNHDHSFTLQAIMEMQKSIGALQASSNNVSSSVDTLSKKLDKTDEKLSGVTHKIYGATAVLAILVALGGFVVNKAWDLMASQITSTVTVQKK
jgi:hypothetical protein